MPFNIYITAVSLIGCIWWIIILSRYRNEPAPFFAVYSLSICVTAFICSVIYLIVFGLVL